jgi:hypothetical protein
MADLIGGKPDETEALPGLSASLGCASQGSSEQVRIRAND